MKGRGVHGTNGFKFIREPVKGDHGLPAMPAQKERLNGLGIAIVDDGPEAESTDPTAHLGMDEREGVVSLGLKDRETLLGCDTDVGFEHDPLHSTGCRIFSIPDRYGIRKHQTSEYTLTMVSAQRCKSNVSPRFNLKA